MFLKGRRSRATVKATKPGCRQNSWLTEVVLGELRCRENLSEIGAIGADGTRLPEKQNRRLNLRAS